MHPIAQLLTKADSKFATVLKESKIAPLRVISASHAIESPRTEDRAIKLAKKAAIGKDDDAAKAARAKKPRSGRGVSPRLLQAAIRGDKQISGPSKQRLLRAVNALRKQKKLGETDLRALF